LESVEVIVPADDTLEPAQPGYKLVIIGATVP